MSCTDECHKPSPFQAHCSVCHRSFTGVTWFDLHRVGGTCRELGDLVEVDGLWATAESHANRELLTARLAKYRSLPQPPL